MTNDRNKTAAILAIVGGALIFVSGSVGMVDFLKALQDIVEGLVGGSNPILETIFWILITGLIVIFMPIFTKLLMIFLMLSSTLSMLLAPVQTILPLLKIKADVLGSLILITKPGNCSGLYSVLDKVAAIFSNGISCSNEELTTMFTTLISFFEVRDYNRHNLILTYLCGSDIIRYQICHIF